MGSLKSREVSSTMEENQIITKIQPTESQPPELKISLKSRKFYFNLVQYENYPKIKNKAHELILLLKEEYHLQ